MNGCKVSELEDILGVSRQAIYDKLKQDKYKVYVSKIKGIKVVSPEGVKALKQEYGIESLCKDIQACKEEECVTLDVECKENKDCKADSSKNCKENQEFKDESEQNCKDFKDCKDESEELKHLREENKRLLALLEQQNALMQQQNQLLLNSQMLQQKALSNTEALLLEKRKELEERKQQYSKKKSWFKRLFKL